MFRSCLTFLISLFAMAALVACGPTYPKCDTDENCAEKGEVCVSGQCQQCREDSNCAEDQTCNGGRCEAKPECSNNEDCSGGLVCKSGECKQECASDADCGSGLKCEDNRCKDPLACAQTSDCAEGMSCIQLRCQQATTDATSTRCFYPTVRFEFNRYNLGSDAKEQLQGVADCLKEKDVSLTIEGHADERGTEEYNLALSERRARAVRDYLRRLGVPSSKLGIIPKGELEPLNEESNEDAWSENRRADFIEQ